MRLKFKGFNRLMLNAHVVLLSVLCVGWSLRSTTGDTVVGVDLSYYSTEGLTLSYDVAMYPEPETTETTYSPYLYKSYTGFREAIGFKESRGDYFVTNSFGYLGKYQFGKSTLRQIGIRDTKRFLNSPALQESAFEAYTSRNKWVLRNDIGRFAGKHINGIYITESGILAAAHLAGPGNVKKFLRSGGRQSANDAYGSNIEHYLKRFSGYDTSVVVPVKNAGVQ